MGILKTIDVNLPKKQDNIILAIAFRNIGMFLIHDRKYFENRENSWAEFLEYFEDIYLDLFEEDKAIVLAKFEEIFNVVYEDIEKNFDELEVIYLGEL
ncbi:hypothetical protein G3W37_27160 [Klebsiella pneumoniae]|uniref:hypothetical protein n=1 Tax=Klebsiella pneumoniae TaxID=573 RepID=UPI001B8BB825|nr:hypothetical protein [Klebsiella pneumoniae]MBR7431796.1 hypothetical protein [Klebsiella pneumoniae]MBR7448457.1 hypothetical protein [Klebsiella pneumoniae]